MIDFDFGISGVLMGGGCVGVLFRIVVKKFSCIDDDVFDMYVVNYVFSIGVCFCR